MHYPTFEVDQEIENLCKSEILSGNGVREYDSQKETQERRFQTIKKEKFHQDERRKEKQYLKCIQEKSCKKTRSTCHSEFRSESRPMHEVERLCSKKVDECKQKHESRLYTKTVLHRLTSGSATTFSVSLALKSLKSEQQDDKRFEAHVSVAKASNQKHSLQTEVDIDMLVQPSSAQETYFFNMKMANEITKPSSKWNINEILGEHLNGQLNIQTSFGVKGKTQKFGSLKIKSSQSEQQRRYATDSFEHKHCLEQKKFGKKLTEECKSARSFASSLDVYEATATVPSSVTQNIYMKTFVDFCNAIFSPYIQSRQKVQLGVEENQYTLIIQAHPKVELLTMIAKGNGVEIELTNIRIPSLIRGYLPLNNKLSGSEKLVNQMTSGNAPSTCSIENGQVKTFDNVEYEYGLNTCEHVIFKDCTESSRVEVTTQRMSSSSKVKVTIDNHVYEVEIPTHGTKPSIKVNGETKTYVTKSQNMQRILKQEEEHLKQYNWEQRKSEFIALEDNYYQDANTFVSSYEDGVYAIVSKLYGMSVYADKDSIEVNTFQHLFRNKACGLCGDLNDEKTADIKSAGECIMSSPKLSAYSYMIEDQCEGIPPEDRQKYRDETQMCLKKETIPTDVSKVFNHKLASYEKHLSEERNNKICISKEKVNICNSSSSPKEVTNKKVRSSFFFI